MLGQPPAISSRSSSVGKSRWTMVSRVPPGSSSKLTCTAVSKLDPSGIVMVEVKTSRRGRSTTRNRFVSRAGVLPGGPKAIVQRPPTRRSQAASTIQSGASAYSSCWASGSVKASKTTSGAAS
jgi:hypothetical protein